jgi:hypothetical protein
LAENFGPRIVLNPFFKLHAGRGEAGVKALLAVGPRAKVIEDELAVDGQEALSFLRKPICARLSSCSMKLWPLR